MHLRCAQQLALSTCTTQETGKRTANAVEQSVEVTLKCARVSVRLCTCRNDINDNDILSGPALRQQLDRYFKRQRIAIEHTQVEVCGRESKRHNNTSGQSYD